MDNLTILQSPLRPQRRRQPVVVEPESSDSDIPQLSQALRHALQERWPEREFLNSDQIKVSKPSPDITVYNTVI